MTYTTYRHAVGAVTVLGDARCSGTFDFSTLTSRSRRHNPRGRRRRRAAAVAADLRGYGDRSKPEGGADHVNYSKRAMARHQVALTRVLGYDRFGVARHDRGGRVAHRMALDHPAAVQRIAVIDIAPTATMYARTDKEFATRYFSSSPIRGRRP